MLIILGQQINRQIIDRLKANLKPNGLLMLVVFCPIVELIPDIAVDIGRRETETRPNLVVDGNVERALALDPIIFAVAKNRIAAERILGQLRIDQYRTADCILVLDEGQIVEYGSHEQLLAQEGQYASLIHNQLATKNVEAISTI